MTVANMKHLPVNPGEQAVLIRKSGKEVFHQSLPPRQRWIHRSDNFEIAKKEKRERERDRGQKIARWIIDMWHSAEGHHAAGWPLPSFFNGHTRRVTSSTQIEAEKLESDDDDGKSDEMSVGFVDWGTNISISTWLTADETDDWQGAAHRHVNTWTGMKKIILARTVFENHTKKSHSTLRAKRATFTLWVDKS